MGLTTSPVIKPKVYTVQQFTASGTWSVPATTDMVDVFMVGGGAGGGGIGINTYSNNGGGGYGGGPGAIVYVTNYPVTPSSSITYTIGAGGAGGVGTVVGNNNYVGGAAGGNTIFGSIYAPGGGVKLGTLGQATTTSRRGGWGVYAAKSREMADEYSNDSYQNITTATWQASYDPNALGFPLGPNSFVVYTDFYKGTQSANSGKIYPGDAPGGGNNNSTGQWGQVAFVGVKKGWSRLFANITEPVGTAGGAANSGLTAQPYSATGGWGGYGGGGLELTSNQYGYIYGYGGGGGGTIGNTTRANTTTAGGAAGANSGSGGGGAYVTSANPAVSQTGNGGAGGSGVIIIGYWT